MAAIVTDPVRTQVLGIPVDVCADVLQAALELRRRVAARSSPSMPR